MYKVNNTLTSAYGDMDLSKKQGPVRENSYFVTKYCPEKGCISAVILYVHVSLHFFT